MPRAPADELRTEWKISLPATLAALVELTLIDPKTGKPTYGARSQLIATLLNEHVKNCGYDPEVDSSNEVNNVAT